MPETVYARDRGVNLAYQVLDDAGPDTLFVPTPRFPIDLIWDDPTVARHLRRLASFGRLILTDLLGLGSSDAVPINERPAMQVWTDGLLAVLDASDTESAAVFGMAGSALPAMLLAASHPERVRSLVLWSPYACFLRTPDQPFAMPEHTYRKMHEIFGEAAGAHNRAVGGQVVGARGTVVKFTGDGALATFDGPARAIMCACAIRESVANLGLSVRVGLHTGEVEMVDGDVHGIAVHIAARIMALARPDEVLVSGAVPPLVLGSGLAFDDRGSHELKGVTDRWPVLAVNEARRLTLGEAVV